MAKTDFVFAELQKELDDMNFDILRIRPMEIHF